LDIFHVQTISEAKSSPNLVSQGRGSGETLNNLVSFGLTYFCYGPLDMYLIVIGAEVFDCLDGLKTVIAIRMQLQLMLASLAEY
jgi:hypothetical protein